LEQALPKSRRQQTETAQFPTGPLTAVQSPTTIDIPIQKKFAPTTQGREVGSFLNTNNNSAQKRGKSAEKSELVRQNSQQKKKTPTIKTTATQHRQVNTVMGVTPLNLFHPATVRSAVGAAAYIPAFTSAIAPQTAVRNAHARAVSSLGGTLTSPLGAGIVINEKMDKMAGSLITEGVGNLISKAPPKRGGSVIPDHDPSHLSVMGGGGTGSATLTGIVAKDQSRNSAQARF
jgi:hypothetical protein